jgi:hypothetical protein
LPPNASDLVLRNVNTGAFEVYNTLLLSCFAVWGTMWNGGPFVRTSLNESFLLLLSRPVFNGEGSERLPSSLRWLFLFWSVGRPMTPDRCRQRAFEAQRRATLATDPIAKADFRQLAQEWLALAEQTEWLEQRYGPEVYADFLRSRSEPVVQQQEQQQQQIQPKDNDRKE